MEFIFHLINFKAKFPIANSMSIAQSNDEDINMVFRTSTDLFPIINSPKHLYYTFP